VRRLLPGCALASALLLMTTSTALAASSVIRASDPNLLAACTAGQGPPTAGAEFNYRDAEVEPFVAVNPLDSSNVIGAWQQDRWSDGGAHGLVAGFSKDGGHTFAESLLPFDSCSAPGNPTVSEYTRASDPWVSIGPDGTAYAISLSVNFQNNDNAVLAATSTDKGATWGNVNVVRFDAGTSAIIPTLTRFFNDKESITADPTRNGVAYAVWDRIESPSATFEANFHARAFHGPTWFSRTTDGGKTWEPARMIFDPGTQNQTIGNIIVVAPNGVLFDFFDLLQTHKNAGGLRGASVAVISSSDQGVHWSAPAIVARDASIGVVDPNNVNPRTNAPPAPLRVGNNVPMVAVDPQTGQLYVTWEDSRFSGGAFDEVVISTSADGGATWTPPKRVNTPTGHPAFTPSVAVTNSGARGVAGTVGVSYYQLEVTSLGSMPTDYFLKRFSSAAVSSSNAASIDGGVTAEDVTAASPTSGPFNMLAAPFARGYFTGDYESLISIGGSFLPFYVQTNCQDLSCRALTSVVPPANRTATNNNSTDVYAGLGF
jgi:hypothetical protein